MTYGIKIDTGNAAFDDGNAPHEVARILRKLADDLESRGALESFKLYDINGNAVGTAKSGVR